MYGPSCRVKALDELFDLPHLDILLRSVRTHIGRRRVRFLGGPGVRCRQAVCKGNLNKARLIFRERNSCCLHLLSSIPLLSRPRPPPLMSQTNNKKRKMEVGAEDSVKRVKVTGSELSVNILKISAKDTVAGPSQSEAQTETHIPGLPENATGPKAKGKERAKADISQKASRHRIRKLVPPRPFPTVPRSVSATGPRSSHREGKNLICLTRKSSLSNYMRRCKDVIINDGYVRLILTAHELLTRVE